MRGIGAACSYHCRAHAYLPVQQSFREGLERARALQDFYAAGGVTADDPLDPSMPGSAAAAPRDGEAAKRSAELGGESSGEDDSGGSADSESNVSDDGGCVVCLENTRQKEIMLCDACNAEYHTFCVVRPGAGWPLLAAAAACFQASVPLCACASPFVSLAN